MGFVFAKLGPKTYLKLGVEHGDGLVVGLFVVVKLPQPHDLSLARTDDFTIEMKGVCWLQEGPVAPEGPQDLGGLALA